VPGSAYPSFLTNWQGFADTLGRGAGGAAVWAGHGAYGTLTFTPTRGTACRGPNGSPTMSGTPAG
jgi:hypothetical protein